MAETKQAVLSRYVKRNGSSASIALLYSHIKANYECLYVCQLPFLDDLKQYQFPPIAPTNSATRKPYIPTAEQCLHDRALHPESQLPKLDPIISKYINPDEAIMENAQDAIKNFQTLFPLTKTTNFKSEPKYRWQDGMLVEQQQEIRLDSYVTDDANASKKRKADDLADYSLDKQSDIINEITYCPTGKRFTQRSILSEGIGVSLNFVVDLSKNQNHWYSGELRDYYESKNRDDFWQLIVTNQIGLITNDESDDSEITEKESKEFLGSKRKTIAINNNQPSKSDSVDDLFDQIE
ncbi:ATP-dependent DNA helicase [Heterostelium album PN500]|uniref:ATP-dependent DNA helicase n=1 Tax=Heterostelium pallidum (strain ATCC 26659 / Pp 5 / PN500) TaxID=670386 RepID=D3BVJ0_HETP5|nr:ATP-dependent DNA helicase [Heterostelium album PN500]EFA74613.1 ATP-dependent DNA helicase [Heterostelium album PN500]|eukprot:XP_020426747.1 ATP-dependent DNA helicase [Heterostelium album PN500]